MIYPDFESFLVPEGNKNHNPYESYSRNIKDMSLAVMIITCYVLKINFVSLFSSLLTLLNIGLVIMFMLIRMLK